MNLDLAALKALVGAAQVSAEDARVILDETHASAEDVESAELRPVWAVIEARVRNRQPIDPIGIRHALRDEPEHVREVGLTVVLEAELGMARERLGMLRDAAVRRRLVESLRAIAVAAKGGKSLSDLDAMLREAPGLLAGAGSRVRNCSGDAVAMLDKLEQAWAGKAEPRLMMGMGNLDEVLGGLINNLIVIGARPGVGKSALVAGLVKRWVDTGIKVGVLSYEDDTRDMACRIVASVADVSVKHVRGDIPCSEFQRGVIADGLEWWARREHLVETDDARPSGSARDVLASMRTMVDRGCRVVVLDNMTCVRLDAGERRHDLVLEEALRDIRSEAQHLRVPAIVVGHLRRGEGMQDEAQKPPKLSDFSNASAWENYARVALGMWRGEEGTRLRVLKQTNGPAGQDFDVELEQAAALVKSATFRREAAAPAAAPKAKYERRRAEVDS